MQENGFQQEAKILYRRLDALFRSIPSDSSQTRLIEVFLGDLFRDFREDIRLSSIFLYQERRTRFSLIDHIGCIESLPAKYLSPGTPALQLLFEHLVYIYTDSSIAYPGSTHASLQKRASSAMVLGDTPNRYVILFLLDPGWEREELDFLLNTLRTALGTRLMESRLLGTFREAAEIQQSLLPDRPPEFPGFDIASTTFPAEEVGGDFFDYILFSDQMLGFSIGDASGHGLPAALLVRDVVIGLRMGLEKEMKMTHAFTKLNRIIHRSRLSSRFISIFYGELEDNGNLIYVNAGHQPPLLYHKGSFRELTSGGTVIGPLPEVQFQRGFVRLEPGASLIAFTDGIVERRNASGEMFGLDRLKKQIAQCQALPASVCLEKVLSEVRSFGNDAPWEDDATLAILKRHRKRQEV